MLEVDWSCYVGPRNHDDGKTPLACEDKKWKEEEEEEEGEGEGEGGIEG